MSEGLFTYHGPKATRYWALYEGKQRGPDWEVVKRGRWQRWRIYVLNQHNTLVQIGYSWSRPLAEWRAQHRIGIFRI